MFSKLADIVMKHSKAIIAIWIIVLLCTLIPFGLRADSVLNYDMTQMSGVNTEATDGQKILDTEFSNSIDLSEIVVITYDSSDELIKANTLSTEFIRLMKEKYGSTLTASSYGTYSKGDPNTNGILMVAIACNEDGYDITHETGNIRNVMSQAKANTGYSLTTYVTGNSAITYDTEKSSMEDVSKIDPLSVLLILVLLGLFFRSLVAAILPPGTIGVAYGIALSVIFAVGSILDVFYITEMLVLVTMLGAGCDYALFIMSRYRDERKKGMDHESALKESIEWAGESVFTSGLAVIIGFGALAICSFSMVQTMGIVLAAGILIALIAALTFIPSIINILGEKVFWPSRVDTYTSIEKGEREGIYAVLCKISKAYFSWLSEVTEKYAVPIVVAALLISVPSVYIFATTTDSSDMISIMPESESTKGLDAIMTQTEGGTIMPTYVVIELTDSVIDRSGTISVGGNSISYLKFKDSALSANGSVPVMMKIANEIDSKYEIAGTVSGTNSWALIYQSTASLLGTTDPNTINHAIEAQMPAAVKGYISAVLSTQISAGVTLYNVPYTQTIGLDGTTQVNVSHVMDFILNKATGILSDNGSFVSMMVITTEKPMSDNTMSFLNSLKADFHNDGGYDKTYSQVIKESYVSGTSAMMNDISKDVNDQFNIIKIVVIVLLIILLFLILGSYLSPIRSMLTIVLSITWTIVLTRLVFNSALGIPVIWLIPIVLFVVLLGLGMDYDIFFTTRARENMVKGMSNDEAISDAVRHAGPVTTLCSLIMGGTFLTMLLAGSSMLKEFGFALGFGILIEGLIMVGFVVPSLMHLMGKLNWKGPKFLQRGKNVSE